MAKAAPKGKKPAARAAKPKRAGSAAPKAAKAAAKKAPLKGAKAKKVNEGDRLYCEVCGLVVTVDDECGCAACDIICCDTQMQVQR